ncbi:MAG: leucine-rich repeat domain-containing protein [Lachnospiraceae bacterium]|nr:leucine-rich repeat domain-containing protein [Lachnospiraceae bacterium]
MKVKRWKLWGILGVAVLLGMGLVAPKAQALDEDRIYEVTGEQHFTFDRETGMITGYQDKEFVDDIADGSAQDSAGDDPVTVVVIPQQIQGIMVKGLTGTFQGNEHIQKVILPDTVEELGDDVFNGCTSLSAICVYQTDLPYFEQQVTENQQQDWNLSYVKVNQLIEDVWEVSPGTSQEPIASAQPDAPDVTEQSGTFLVDDSSDPSNEPEGDSDGETGYFEIIDRGRCAVIPASLQSVGQRTFDSCGIASFDVLDGSEYFKDSGEGGMNLQEGVGACLISLDGTKLYRIAPRFRDQDNSLQYSIPEGVEEVMPYAGQGLGDKHEVKVADSVKTIDSYAFYQSGLLRITFTENAQAETIGDWAFAYNDSLEITLPASVQTIGKYCFAYITNRTPDLSKTQITVIPEYAFAGCPNLHTITMPPTLQVIENYAFAGNANLNEVVFTGSTLTSIGTGAFQNCTNMHKIDIPAGITTIEQDTFAGCSNLNEVILPEGVKEIKDNAFSSCPNIHHMVIPSTVTFIAGNSFTGSNTKEIDTSKNAYAQAALGGTTSVSATPPVTTPEMPGMGYQKTIGKLVYKVTGKGTVTLVKPSSKAIKQVTVPASVKINGFTFRVTAVSAKAFAQCKKLKTVTIGVNVSSIGKQAFKNCKKLSKITIRTGKLKKGTVGAGAFKGIAGKATIKVPKKKLKIYKKFLYKKGVGKKAKIKK